MKEQELPIAVAIAPIMVSSSPPPAPNTLDCSEICVLVSALVAFACYSCALIWPMFYFSSLVLFIVAFTLAAVAICGNKQAQLLIPIVAVSATLSFMAVVLGGMTVVDYSQKCSSHKDLDERHIQASYTIDCEQGTLVFIFWLLGNIIACILMIVTLSVGSCAFSARQRRQRAYPTRESRWITIAVKALAVVMVLILVIVGLVETIHGHKTGSVDGTCPAGVDFFSKPEYNDIGCCTWLHNKGTCCHQQACDNKPSYEYFESSGNEKCNDLRGLLSCSVCRKDSGLFATSMTNITVCQSFCDQLQTHCGSCSDVLDANFVVVPNSYKPFCFDSASSVATHIFAVVVLGLTVGLFSV